MKLAVTETQQMPLDPSFWKIRDDDVVILNPPDGPHRILRYGVQPTPTTCPACGAPRTCCGGAKAE